MYGRTAAHIAAARGELLILKHLDSISFDFAQLDFDGRTAIECIPRKGLEEEVRESCRQLLAFAISGLAVADGST